MDEVERDVLRISEARGQSTLTGMKELVNHAIGTIEHFFNRKGELSGLATGFYDFDRMTDGLHGGEMIVIAARPSMGKTSLAMNIAEHIALELKLPVGVFSLEMSAESLVLRMMCSIARVNLRNIRDGFMSEADFPKLSHGGREIVGGPSCLLTRRRGSPFCKCARARGAWPNNMGLNFLWLIICSFCILLRGDLRKIGSRKSPKFPAASRPWPRN